MPDSDADFESSAKDEAITFKRTNRHGFLLGIPTLFIYPLVWMAQITEELKAKALEMGVQGSHMSWWHMFGWNTFGLLLFGPVAATHRFFSTMSKVEDAMNHEPARIKGTHI